MTDEQYKEVIHIGTKDNRYFDLTDNIKHCDYYDDKDNIMYHPEIPEMHNITLIDAIPFFLLMKSQLPNLQRENIKLTVFMDYVVSYKQKAMINEFPLMLKGINNLHSHKVFPLTKSLTELQKEISKMETQKDIELKKAEIKIEETKEIPDGDLKNER